MTLGDASLAVVWWNDYTSAMDSVRFGRALGMGARHAAKALVTAADAAAAPNPSSNAAGSQHKATGSQQQAAGSQQQARAAQPSPAASVGSVGQRAAQATAQKAAQVRQTGEAVARGSKRFGEAAWGPFVKLSGVLWLELTGVFFGLFVLTAGMNAWRLRDSLHETALNHTNHQHFLFSVVMMAVFGYFCASSFVRASRKGRTGR